MRKDKIDINSSILPGASFYIIEDYLRVHLRPYLRRFHSTLDSRLPEKITAIIKFLELLNYLSEVHSKGETISVKELFEKKFTCMEIQKFKRNYKILIDRDTVPANPDFVKQWNLLDSGVKIEVSGEVMIKLYGIPNCDKIRKAKKLLEQSCISHEFINIRECIPEEKSIKQWIETLGEKELINKRSTTYRNLKSNELNRSDVFDWISLIRKHPTLIQRPLFEAKGEVKVGLASLIETIEELN
tara:strand:- start:11 stop:739 length:729 start_codon:yes stop_codon:yes gene_type:complete